MHKLAAEAVGTFGLVCAGTGAVVINRATNGGVSHVGIGLTFGLIIMVMIYAFGHVSGASMNPARSLAPAIVSWTWQDQWVYVAGPAIGAVAGVLLYNWIRTGEPARTPTGKGGQH